MQTHYEDQIATILDGLRIDAAHHRITLATDGSETAYEPGTLRTTLTSLIYQHFYCAGDGYQPGESGAGPSPDSFVDALRCANHSREQFDSPWTVSAVDMAGTIYAAKGNDRRMVYAGEFVYDQPKRGPAQPGDILRLHLHPDHRDAQRGFYYVFGQTPGDESVTLQTRLYFHTVPEGSTRLLAWVTQTLNTHRIPFQFKCLNHPDLYGRSDPAVLYLQKPYVSHVLDLLASDLPQLRPYLLPTVPLFTRLLTPGVAFAESPPNPAESFGTSRCVLVAQGIATAVANQQPADTYIDAIRAVFMELGLSIDHPYRNPRAHYPYCFPDFSSN
ncbi:T3SS effector HopA1 family protein [Spirosoma utsteinense]|uniref:Uncharacterized protein n=1 Tax=Spirosoma utsteinense TaxID=2585773 RepID=A0ABR6W3Y7_9BACT|nr:T3SS effector HopA1 family protein [Spirosoma utsteinense]MBC3787139.1 hypothetical protein [Spirosoma utsteinense]MBC3791311.1 hypothetical protein [Spirosoma utsteinense]